MRVLMTTDTVGGVWTFCQEMAAGLLERGHPVLLISFGRIPSTAQREQCELLTHSYQGRFQYLASHDSVEWMEGDQSSIDRGLDLIEREALRFAPDLIHASQFSHGAVDLPIPRVITAHRDVLGRARACKKSPDLHSPWLARYRSMAQRGLAGGGVGIGR